MSRFKFKTTYLENCGVELKPIHQCYPVLKYRVVDEPYMLFVNLNTNKAVILKSNDYSPRVNIEEDFESLPKKIQNMIIFNAEMF